MEQEMLRIEELRFDENGLIPAVVVESFFKSSSGSFSFSMIFSFLAIFQVLQCAFLIFHVFQ